MQIINNVNSITFSHNGRNYVKNFIIIKQGATNIAIHNSFDTRHQLVSSTHYSQFTVDGIVYGSQADLMEALSLILFSKAGVNGEITTTSQLINDGENGIHPFITANQLPQANQILNENGYSLSGETLTMFDGWVWTIENIQYMNNVDVDLSVPESASGTTRIDIVVATSGNTFDIIQGTEVEENPIAPPVPVGALLATFIYVGDGTSETIIQPTPIGDDYLPKSDEFIAQFGSLTGSISNLGLKSYTNYIFKDTCSVTQIDSASFLNGINVYKGKRIRFTNKQSTPITFKHNIGTGSIKFDLINDSDFILKKDETIEFILDNTENLLIQIINNNPENNSSLTNKAIQVITDCSSWQLNTSLTFVSTISASGVGWNSGNTLKTSTPSNTTDATILLTNNTVVPIALVNKDSYLKKLVLESRYSYYRESDRFLIGYFQKNNNPTTSTESLEHINPTVIFDEIVNYGDAFDGLYEVININSSILIPENSMLVYAIASNDSVSSSTIQRIYTLSTLIELEQI